MGKKTLNKNIDKSKPHVKKDMGIFPKDRNIDYSDIVNVKESMSDKTADEKITPEQLIEQAKEFEDAFESDKALKSYNKAIKLLENTDDNDRLVECLEASAYILIELEKDEAGKERLQRCVLLSPDEGHEKYFFLAQLAKDKEAINLYRKGLLVLDAAKKKLTNSESSSTDPDKFKEEMEDLVMDESQAYCAIAELFMTDLCDETDAEKECIEAIQLATLKAPESPQAWMTMANFHTVKGNKSEAEHAVNKCLEFWWPKVKAYLDLSKDDDSAIMSADDGEEDIAECEIKEKDEVDETEDAEKGQADDKPESMDTSDESDLGEEDLENQIDLEELTRIPFAAHIVLVRNMLELDMNEKAAEVLDVLLEEDDSNPEVYYLLTEVGGRLNWKESDPDTLRYYASICKADRDGKPMTREAILADTLSDSL